MTHAFRGAIAKNLARTSLLSPTPLQLPRLPLPPPPFPSPYTPGSYGGMWETAYHVCDASVRHLTKPLVLSSPSLLPIYFSLSIRVGSKTIVFFLMLLVNTLPASLSYHPGAVIPPSRPDRKTNRFHSTLSSLHIKSVSQAVLGRMRPTLQVTRSTPHGASRLVQEISYLPDR